MPNPVTHWQIISQDPERPSAFYRDLFNWRINAANAMNYRQVDTGDGRFQGGFWPAPPQAPSMVQLFVSVDDVAATVERTVALGGKVLIPPQTLPDGDQMAVLLDPEGMSFGVTRSARSSETT